MRGNAKPKMNLQAVIIKLPLLRQKVVWLHLWHVCFFTNKMWKMCFS